MEKFKILTESSPWFIFLCLLAGFGYAWLLYGKKSSWSKSTNYILFGLRFAVASILFFLFTGPLIKLVKNYLEKPTYVLAIDNSQSLKLVQDSSKLNLLKQQLSELTSRLQSEDISVDIQTLDENTKIQNPSEVQFTEKTSNLSKILSRVSGNYENRNLAGVILVSDGIYNDGGDPLYEEYNFPIYTVGTGDPIEKKDLKIKTLKYNKIAYAGNKFPIVAEVLNNGLRGTAKISLKQGAKTLEQKTINLDSRSLVQIEFTLSAEKPGLQHFIVELESVSGEFTTTNNIAHAYIEVINAKEKVLLVALTPHPDIKALRNAIESKENYEFEMFVPAINKLKEDKYDLIIYHQFPDLSNSYPEIIDKLLKQAKAHFFILGNQSNIARFNQIVSILQIKANGQQKDLVGSKYNPNYSRFLIESEDIKIINNFPPITVPFGDYTNSADAEVLIYQKVGSVETENPILVSGQREGKKYAVLTGEGIWQWRLDEMRESGEAKVFDKLFSSLIQYLSSKEDKRKFRLYPSDNEYTESDRILFQAELYNDIYENIYGQRVDMDIKNEAEKSQHYSFTTSEDNTGFEIKGLKPGLYKYSGSTKYNNQTYTASGEFVIRETQLEALNLTADFGLLKELASKSKGAFVSSNEIEKLSGLLQKEKKAAIIHSNEEFQEFINLPWIFFLILILVSIEWGMRKYHGRV